MSQVESLKETIFSKLNEALKADNIESATRLAEIYVGICQAEFRKDSDRPAGFNV